MATSKNFLTFSQQVESLKNDKHIIIPDQQYAEEILQRIGYFSLMGGYKHLFRVPFAKKYNNISLWITTSVLTFGSLSKMYNVLPQSH